MKTSVIIPIYKVESYLRRAVGSVIAQSHRDLEIILVDDGSPDGCPQICDELAMTDARIKVIHQANRGVSAARNAGLDVAMGDFIQFLDGDDSLEPKAIETLLRVVVESGADLVTCGHFRTSVGADGQVLSSDPQRQCQAGTFSRKAFLERFAGCGYLVYAGWEYCWDKLFRRELIQRHDLRFREGLRLCEDRFFNLAYILGAEKICAIEESLCNHYLPAPSALHTSATTGYDPSRWEVHQQAFDALHELLGKNDCLTPAVLEGVGRDYVNTMVVAVYRCCRWDSGLSFRDRLPPIRQIVGHPMMQASLKSYTRQSAREDRYMPFLMKMNSAVLVCAYATWKAKRIYGGRKN